MQTVRDILKNPWLRLAAIVITIVLLGWFVYYTRDIFVPFLLAFIVAYILNPAVDLLEKIKIPRSLGILIMAIIVISLLAGVVAILVYDIHSALTADNATNTNAAKAADSNSIISTEVLTNPETLNTRLESQIHRLPESMQPYANSIVKLVYQHVIPKLKGLLQYTDEAIIAVLTSAASVVKGILNLFIFIIVAFYLLRDYHKFMDRCMAYVPPRYRDSTIRITSQIDTDLRGFFRGQLMVAATLSIIYFIGMLIAGIPYALPVAIISGIGNLIPYMGTFVGICLGLGASAVNYGFDIHLLYVILVFIAAQSLDGMVVSPLLLGKNVGMNPVIVVLALMVFGKTLGFLGLLFAVPLAALVRVFLKEMYERVEIKGQIQTGSNTVIVPDNAESIPPKNNQ